MSHLLEQIVGLNRTNHGSFKGWVRHCLALGQWLSGGLDPFVAPDLSRIERLVFVCLGNINRSCFAEAVARQAGGNAVSLGLSTTTGAPAFHAAIATAARRGVDLQPHHATDIHDHRPRPGDLLLAMEVRHIHRLRASALGQGPVALLGAWSYPRRIHIHDPHTLSPDYFETCFTVIESATRQLVRQWKVARGESDVA